jgi:DNA adenine methylase
VTKGEFRDRLPRPFLKWAGGKSQLLAQYESLLPAKWSRYHEPFLGGGALFFHLHPERASLGDANAELIDCYRAVRDELEAVVEALRRHPYESDHYYAVRALDPGALPLPERAARTIYLNRTGFNGLYRVNASGGFNVPFGRYVNPRILDEANLRACSEVLREADLACAPFAAVLECARRGDFVYFDPPYQPLSKTSFFTAYAKGGFGQAEQRELAGVFADLDRRGVLAMLSNSDAPLVHELYHRYRIDRVQARRSINANSERRGAISEVVVRNY